MSADQPGQAVEAHGTMAKAGVAVVRPFMRDPVDEGYRSALFAATSRRAGEEQIEGAHVVPDCKVTEPSSQAGDEELQERLWELTVDVLKGRPGNLPYLRDQVQMKKSPTDESSIKSRTKRRSLNCQTQSCHNS
ncbi:hypothetical protein LA080_003091 [Diaporthe eres]|nr:hypothetical protein LA080_003091 [Diaporthe eres]